MFPLKKDLFQNKSGSALLMVILILAAFLITIIAAVELVIQGLQMGGIQADSTRAYFAGEAGIEEALWKVRRGGSGLPASDTEGVFTGSLDNGSTYTVNYVASSTVILRSIGDYEGIRRSVEVEW